MLELAEWRSEGNKYRILGSTPNRLVSFVAWREGRHQDCISASQTGLGVALEKAASQSKVRKVRWSGTKGRLPVTCSAKTQQATAMELLGCQQYLRSVQLMYLYYLRYLMKFKEMCTDTDTEVR